eukprot:TRINITY_DN5394_c0_g1_i1.p2 TRINITY_DN5394_c0_g1~~TRINITY_DN5394_c0_g1_i1.p2  ORF type:complete len:146 (+),score=39.38 TRINITY_DN5394_c0_g1_i1:99-536(+)
MRNTGPPKYREWRWANTVLPLYPAEETVVDPLMKDVQKPISECAHMTIGALNAKGCLPKLTDAIAELAKTPDSPGGRFQENRLRDCFKDVIQAEVSKGVMTPEDMLEIFPVPIIAEPSGGGSRSGSRRPSKSGLRKGSKEAVEGA